MRRWQVGIGVVLFIGIWVILGLQVADTATTILPVAESCFQTAVGPVSSGSVNMYVPGTTMAKITWQNSSQTVANTQPIQLDANGCAIIYGVGSYRQQLFTGPVVGGLTTGNLVFDLTTTDTSAYNSWFYAGSATGTVNSISLADSGFSGASGTNIQFIPIGQNTGPVQITITGITPTVTASLYKDTSTGPVALTGGEMAANNISNIVYDSVAGIFHLQNPLQSASTTVGVPVSGEISCTGFTAPSGFLFESGQAVARSAYPTLLASYTSIQSGTTTVSSPFITGMNSTAGFTIGMPIESSNFTSGTTIAGIVSGTELQASNNANASGTVTVTVFAYGDGDGATTFNLADRRGVTLVGVDNMNGTARGLLNPTYTTASPDGLSANLRNPAGIGGGIQITQANLPPLSFPVSGTTLTNGTTSQTICNAAGSGCTGGSTPALYESSVASAPSTGTGLVTTNVSVNAQGFASSGGSQTAFSVIQPGTTTNWCVRVQ